MELAFNNLLFIFFAYSFLGYLVETITVLIGTKKLRNVGFLTGPFCPTYGIVMCLMIVIVPNYINGFVIFALGFILSFIVELLISYILEAVFKIRWWYYYWAPLNIDGRVSPIVSIFWGFLICLSLKYIYPLIVDIINYITDDNMKIILTILIIVLMIDVIISSLMAFKLQDILKLVKGKYTNKKADDIEKNELAIKRYYSQLVGHIKQMDKNKIDMKISFLLAKIKRK